jgi:hypothetical protein
MNTVLAERILPRYCTEVTMTTLNPMGPSPEDRMEPMYDDPPGFGWLFFAGTVIGLAGLMRVFDSIWAFRFDGALPPGLSDTLLGDNINTYAWTWLIVGLVLIFSSFLLLTGSQFARWVGFFAATIMALSAATWLPYYPVWSLIYIVIAVLVFHALSRYGGRQTI